MTAKGKAAISCFIIAIIVALIVNPARYAQSALNGLLLFGTAVLPSLFPFFFFSKALTAIGTAATLSGAFKKPMKKLYNAPPASAYVFVMSVISGYPIGANLTATYYSNGYIDSEQAKAMTSFCSTSGPLFVIGTVATQAFDNPAYGYILLSAHIIGALINGLLYRCKSTTVKYDAPLPERADNVLSDCASSSVQSILLVGAFIVIFSIIIDFAYDIGLIPLIESAADAIGINSDIAEGILVGGIEVTRGSLLLASVNADIRLLLSIVCGLISFGGLGIAMQSLNFLGKCKVSAGSFLLRKFTQAIISFLLCLALTYAIL